MPVPRSRLVARIAAAGSIVLLACHPPVAPSAPAAQPEPPRPADDGVLDAPGVAPAILSAHLSRAADPQLEGQDGLLVVFNVQLDAASMQPRAFVVSRDDAGPVWPARAIFAPASEDDENRSILLVGDFGGAERSPTHVAVSGVLFTEDGTSLVGLGAPVLPFATPPRVVAFEVLPGAPGRCEGAPQLVRTYWSDELRGVEADDLARVRIHTGAAEPTHPLRFDDHDAAHDEAGQDNVLDLCVAESAPVVSVGVEAGAFRDVAGHASAAIELRMDDPGA